MMRRAFASLFVAGLLCGTAGVALSANTPTAETEAVDLCSAERHTVAKQVVELTKEEWAATHPDSTNQYEKLSEYWVPQLRSHCGVASSVISINSLVDEPMLTQDSLFTDDVNAIITQDVVYKIGLTLDELERIVEARTDLHAKKHQAGTEGASVDDFRTALVAVRQDENSRVIINFSRESLAGEGELRGHFSPVWDYDAANDRIFMLEVNGEKKHYWVGVEDMYSAMCAVDSISGVSRGWVVVTKDAGEKKDESAGM